MANGDGGSTAPAGGADTATQSTPDVTASTDSPAGIVSMALRIEDAKKKGKVVDINFENVILTSFAPFPYNARAALLFPSFFAIAPLFLL